MGKRKKRLQPAIEQLVIGSIDTTDETFRYRKALTDVEGLADDIAINGQITPVILRPCGQDRYQLISGFRRIAAIRLLGLTSVLARVYSDCTDQQAEALSISENFQRTDFSDLEKAYVCERLRERGLTTKEVGKATAMSERNVRNLRSVLRAAATVQDALHAGDVTLSVAIELAREENVFLAPDFTVDAVVKRVIAEGMSVRGVKALMQELKAAAVGSAGRPGPPNRKGRGPFVPVRLVEQKNGGFDLVVKWRATRRPEELNSIEQALERTLVRIRELRKSGQAGDLQPVPASSGSQPRGPEQPRGESAHI